MTDDAQPRGQSPLFRKTSHCLMLLGYSCVAAAGVFLLRFSVGREDAGKVTAIAVVAIAVAILGGIHKVSMLIKRKP